MLVMFTANIINDAMKKMEKWKKRDLQPSRKTKTDKGTFRIRK